MAEINFKTTRQHVKKISLQATHQTSFGKKTEPKPNVPHW